MLVGSRVMISWWFGFLRDETKHLKKQSGVWMTLLRRLVPNAACFQIRPSIWRHHLTRRAITLTCGVRQLLSLVPGLRILLRSPKQRTSVKLTALGVTEKSPEWTGKQLRLPLDLNTTLTVHKSVDSALCRTTNYQTLLRWPVHLTGMM